MAMTIEELAKSLNDRFAALGEQISEAKLRDLIKAELPGLLGDEAFVRKMRFGGEGDPQLAGTKFARWGLSALDVEFLYDVMNASRGHALQEGGLHPGPSEALQRTFKAISDAVYLPSERIREMDRQALDNLFPRVPVRDFYGLDRELAARGRWDETEAYRQAVRAMDTAETGFGLQLVGAQYVASLWEGARNDMQVFGRINSFEMTQPTAYLPVEAALPEMLFVAETTGPDGAKYSTSKSGSNRVQVDAKKFIIRQMWSGEMEEDSIIPFVPFLRRQLQKALAFYSDSLVLNGDNTSAGTGNINSDDGAPSSTKHYLAFDGLLHACIVDNTGNKVDLAGNVVTWDNIKSMKKLMIDRTYLHDWSHPQNADDLIYVCDPEMGDRIDMIDEYRTLDKAGNRATIVNGEVKAIGPHPLIRSIAMSLTEADGKASVTPASNTLGRLLSFNINGAVTGWRRRIQVETKREPGADQNEIISSLRLGMGRFSPTGAASGIEWASLLYDAAV